MKNRGFTLLELLGVIVILALLTTLVFPSVLNAIKKSSNETDKLSMDLINNATDLYIENHANDFEKINGSKFIIDMNELIEEGFLPESIKLTDVEKIEENYVLVKYDNDKFNYEVKSKNDFHNITGTNNLVLGSDNYNILNYKIYGNSVQNGTPTPETPVEIESVGDKTKNLWKSTDNVIGSLAISNGSINTGVKFVTTTDFIPLKAGTYIISHETGVNLRYIAWYNENKEIVGNVWSYRENPFKFTLDNDYLVRIDMERAGNSTIDNLETFYEDYQVQLEEGAVATDYEPYGYKIPVKVRGKNLFNIKNISDYLVTNQFIEFYEDYSGFIMKWTAFDNGSSIGKLSVLCPELKVGDTFRISFESNAYRQNRDVNYFYLNKYGNTIFQGRSYVCTQEMLDSSVYAYRGEVENAYIKNIQFELGTTTTDYEPYQEPITTNIYLKEPLRKIKDYADYIDFENKKVVRKITKIILDGTQKFVPNTKVVEGYDTYHTYYNQELPSGLRTNASVMSNKLIGNYTWSIVKDYKREQIASAPVSFTLRIAQSRGVEHSADGINNWLKENPIDVLFILETPIEETIELPNIPTLEGTTILSVDTAIKPSNIEIFGYNDN